MVIAGAECQSKMVSTFLTFSLSFTVSAISNGKGCNCLEKSFHVK